MTMHRTIGLAFFGVIAGGLASVVFSTPASKLVQAQTAASAAPGAVGRYQLSAYGYGLGDGSTGSLSEHGAYILDIQTGEVFVVRHHDAPKSLGSVGKRWPPGDQSPPPSPLPVGPSLPSTDSVGIPEGMSRVEATKTLTAMGFETWTDASVSDHWVRFRKPWQHGYHLVNLRFDGEKVLEVGEFWNDPGGGLKGSGAHTGYFGLPRKTGVRCHSRVRQAHGEIDRLGKRHCSRSKHWTCGLEMVC
jgi:hypothetical protein